MRVRIDSLRLMSCFFSKIVNPAFFVTKLEAYGIRIVELDGISVITGFFVKKNFRKRLFLLIFTSIMTQQ